MMRRSIVLRTALLMIVLSLVVGFWGTPAGVIAHPGTNIKAPKAKNISKGQETAYDVTNTVQGQAIIAHAVERMKLQAQAVMDPKNLKAFNFGMSDAQDVLIMPKDAQFEHASTTLNDDGSVKTSAAISFAVFPQTKKQQVASMSYGNWSRVNEKCWYISNSTGEQTHCAHVYRENNDASTTKDFYQLNHFGTARGINPFALINQTVESYRNPTISSAMTWVDWKPRADSTVGACTTVEIGLYGLAISGYQCETWDITFYNTEPGHFKNVWRSGNFGKYNTEREVEYTQEVSVPQNGTVSWTLQGGFYAYP